MNILIIGTGYVGTTTALVFAELGHQVTGLDKDVSKIELLNNGRLHFFEPGLGSLLKKHLEQNLLHFTTDQENAIKRNDIIYICVGTPRDSDGSANLSYVEQVANVIGKYRNRYKVVVTKSTVPVGTAEKVHQWIADDNPESQIPFDVVSNPEFLREGNALEDALHPDRIVIGGSSQKAINLIRSLYQNMHAPIIVTNSRAAELIKYTANSFLAMKISYINEIAKLCDKLDISIEDVAQGIRSDHRIGPHFLNAGMGYGGSCFPKDVAALLEVSKRNQVNLSILEKVVTVNEAQPFYLIQKLSEKLGSLKGKKIGVLGLAFKPGTDDVRESPAFVLIQDLLSKNVKVSVHDPVVKIADHLDSHQIVQCDSIVGAARNTDALVLSTNWEQYLKVDWLNVKRVMKTPYIFDGRNMLDAQKMKNDGFDYEGIGC